MTVPSATPGERLVELVLKAQSHRDAIREYGLAGYITMVEKHRSMLAGVHAQIRDHCERHALPLPREVLVVAR